MIDVAFVARTRINIGIGAQPFMHLAAKQFVNRLVRFFTDDIPACHFKRREHSHQCQIGMLSEAARINPAPHRLYVMRIIASDISAKHILDHLGDKMRLERNAIGLANPGNAGICRDLHKDEIATTKMRWRIANNERLDIGQLHYVRNPLIDLISRKSRTPNSPYSRPLPDCLYPPNGAM